MKVQFITRQECPLCDEAEVMLRSMERRFALEIETVDVDTDDELLSLYRDTVPVARSEDGTVLAAGIWTESGLIAALTRFRLGGG